MTGPVVSLLPVRNAEADLPGHLESVSRYADLVIALDDGSTDATRDVLEGHALVHTVLTNPRREGYAGWDDAANRNRLLEAAIEISASWAMELDADELISPDDAAALRSFIHIGADPDDAYLFRVLRMIGDMEHHDGSDLWVGRLFAPRPGHRFPVDLLHFVPLPTAIPRDRWRRTTVRIQHRGSITVDDRQARFAKYREVDPDRRWQASYDHLLRAPDRPLRWWPRGRLLPVLAQQPVVDAEPLRPDEPALSVVVAVPPGPALNDLIRPTIESILEQELGDVIDRCEGAQLSMVEIVVALPGPLLGDDQVVVEEIQAEWPQVRVAFTGEATDGANDDPSGESSSDGGRSAMNRALTVATGRHLLFVDPSTAFEPGCIRSVLESQQGGWPMVGFVPHIESRSRAAWAGYFLEWSDALPDRGAFDFDSAPRLCSFHRDLLDEIGRFRSDIAGDVSLASDVATASATVARELFERGYGAHRPAGAVISVGAWPGGGSGGSGGTRSTIGFGMSSGVRSLLRERFARGRSEGRAVAQEVTAGVVERRRAVRVWARSLPVGIRRIDRDVRRWGGPDRRRYYGSLPWVLLGALASWLGQGFQMARQLAPSAFGTRRRSRSR